MSINFDQELSSYRKLIGKALIVKTNNISDLSMSDSECISAYKTFTDYFPFITFYSIDVELANQVINTDSLRSNENSFDVLFFLNFPVTGFKYFISKYFPILNEKSRGGFIFLMATSSLSIEDVGDVSRHLKSLLCQEIRGSIFGISHDSLDQDVHNCCFILSWGNL